MSVDNDGYMMTDLLLSVWCGWDRVLERYRSSAKISKALWNWLPRSSIRPAVPRRIGEIHSCSHAFTFRCRV